MEEEFDVKKIIQKEKKEKESKEERALLIQRAIAFIVDMFLISMIVSIISIPFIDNAKVEDIENQTISLTQSYMNQEISISEYTTTYQNNYYKLARLSGPVTLLTIFFNVLYFVVYQVYKKGQTLGKKLLKIRVISEEGELNYNQMIFRSLISNFILVNVITFLFMIFASKSVYFYVSMMFESIQYIIVLVSAIMIVTRKDGCAIHDKLVHTKVIREK